MAQAPEIVNEYIFRLVFGAALFLILALRASLVFSASRTDVTSLKRTAADSFMEDRVSGTESRKRQNIQSSTTTSALSSLAAAEESASQTSGHDLHVSAAAAGMVGQANSNLSLFDRTEKRVPALQRHLEVSTPNLASNSSAVSGFSVFSARQDSAHRTTNDVCALPQVNANLVSQVNHAILGNASFPVAADGSVSKSIVNTSVQRLDNSAGSSSVKSTCHLQKISVYDYSRVLTQKAGLERQLLALRDRLKTKTQEYEQCEQKVSQLAADFVGASRHIFSFRALSFISSVFAY